MKGRLHGSTTCNWLKRCVFNSAYGSLGTPYFRFFDVRQAIAITTAGQLSIRWIENALNRYLNKLLKTQNKDFVIASDTDSVYLCLDELVKQSFKTTHNLDTKKVIRFLDKVCELKLQPFIDKMYTELAEYTNAFDQRMYMKREALADVGLWTAKKRYTLRVYNSEGVEYAEPEIKVTGLEIIKSSTPAAVRKKLREALPVILSGEESDIIDFIDEFRYEFSKLPVQDIASPRSVNNIRKYSDRDSSGWKTSTPIHVKGSIVYNNLIKSMKLQSKYPQINDGEKIKFIYLREPNVLKSHVISFPDVLPKELDVHRWIDYDTQFEKSFVEPLKIILDVIGWKTERVNALDV